MVALLLVSVGPFPPGAVGPEPWGGTLSPVSKETTVTKLTQEAGDCCFVFFSEPWLMNYDGSFYIWGFEYYL